MMVRKQTNPGLYGSGLDEKGWTALKDALGFAEAGADAVKIPEHLKEHEVAIYIEEYLAGKRRNLNKAAQALVPGTDDYGLILMKS